MRNLKHVIFTVICLVMMLLIGCTKKEATYVNQADTTTSTKDLTAANDSAGTDSAEDTELKTESSVNTAAESEPVEILVAAAASLQKSMEEIKGLYEKEHPNVIITYTFGSSGTLQEQIEQGAPIDIFLSAALKQMKALQEKGLILDGTVKELLENKVVLVVNKENKLGITGFDDVLKAPLIALGDPESVPAGQYAKEVFTSLDIWDKVKDKASYGKDVTEVLTWVSSGNMEAGVVYATDAKSNTSVTVAAEAPEGSCSKVIYPVGVVKETKVAAAAKAFTEYLASEEALGVFEDYGFTVNKSKE